MQLFFNNVFSYTMIFLSKAFIANKTYNIVKYILKHHQDFFANIRHYTGCPKSNLKSNEVLGTPCINVAT